MTFADWQSLPPERAADEVLRRAEGLGAQRRATIASMPEREALIARFAAARRGPLRGVPYFAKDLFHLQDEPLWAGSVLFAELQVESKADGSMVRALEAAGAVCAGRTHLHEFAYGLTGQNPHYGDCEHPHFPGRDTGGSSSGSAAVVAADVTPLALGTDTGGSIRVPAAYCGLYGFRMTPGHPWIADAFPLAPSFDTAGWFARTAADMAASLDALCGRPEPAGTPRGLYLEMPDLDDDVQGALRREVDEWGIGTDPGESERFGEELQEVAKAYAIVQSLEAYEVHQPFLDLYRDRYSPEVWSRIDRGRNWTAEQRDWARERHEAVQALWGDYFSRWDYLALAAAPTAAPLKANLTAANRYRILALTAPASLGGMPVLTIPLPLASGLTAGLQIIVPDVNSPVLSWALTRGPL